MANQIVSQAIGAKTEKEENGILKLISQTKWADDEQELFSSDKCRWGKPLTET